MTILDVLRFLIGGRSANNLIELLNGLKRTAPDAAGKIDEVLALFSASISPANLAAVAAAVAKELGDIAQGKINPRNHPGDAA